MKSFPSKKGESEESPIKKKEKVKNFRLKKVEREVSPIKKGERELIGNVTVNVMYILIFFESMYI